MQSSAKLKLTQNTPREGRLPSCFENGCAVPKVTRRLQDIANPMVQPICLGQSTCPRAAPARPDPFFAFSTSIFRIHEEDLSEDHDHMCSKSFHGHRLFLSRNKFPEDHDHMCQKAFFRESWSWSSSFSFPI